MKMYLKNSKGFTLIELLVVISIIGLLSSVVLTSLNGAKSKARDTKRVSELRAVGIALSLYYNDYGTFCVQGVGFNGIGWGWLNYDYPTYSRIAQELVDLGYLGGAPTDPIQGDPGGYLIACNANNFSLYATLERSSTMPDCSMNLLSNYDTNFGKNYCISQ